MDHTHQVLLDTLIFMSPYRKKPKIPRGCVRCMCGALVVKGETLLTHIRKCPVMIRYAGEQGVKPDELYTPHGWRLLRMKNVDTDTINKKTAQ